MQPDFSRGHLDTTVHSMGKEVSLDVDEYEKEGSNDSCRSRVIVHGRRPQKVVQGDLEGLLGNDTPSVGSGRRF